MASAFFVAAAGIGWERRAAWLIGLPALLPLCNLYPWSGWIAFEEFDLLVLGVAAGGFARLANRPTRLAGMSARDRPPAGMSAASIVALALFLASVAISALRGIADAGGFHFGWYQGYHEPLNSVRLAKPFVWALLLWPLWQSASRTDAARSNARLGIGLVLGLTLAAIAAIWERLAYAGLLNFSSSYRTSALFWEMHVGGAAIDGFLALTLPFAVREVLVARTRLRWATAAGATMLGGYACLSTFSRALYVAVPIGLGVLVWLHSTRRQRLAATAQHAIDRESKGGFVSGAVLLAGFVAAAAWMFPTSGYRGMLALLGACAGVLALPRWLRGLGAREWIVASAAGGLLAAVAWLASIALPKGAYLAYGASAALLATALAAASAGAGRNDRTGRAPVYVALAACIALLATLVMVARHWGGHPGLDRAWPVGAGLLFGLVFASRRRLPWWPEALRWQSGVWGAMVMAAGVVGVFAGGNYMSERFAGGNTPDIGGRMHNWRLGLAALDTPLDWAFGNGLGRFPAHYALALATTDRRPGDYRRIADAEGSRLALGAGTHPLGWLELLRISQGVASPGVPATVRLEVRAAGTAQLHFEVCEKHLLYSEACLAKTLMAPRAPGRWQTLEVGLEGPRPTTGAWYAPKRIVFAFGVANQGERVEVRRLHLAGPDGRNLLANGSFDDGLAHWYFTSDGYQMPWHIEGLLTNALFDQGLVGVALLITLLGGALWRLARGHARDHPLAPAVAAALVGCALLALFTSVTDVPRVACLFYFLLILGHGLRSPPAPSR